MENEQMKLITIFLLFAHSAVFSQAKDSVSFQFVKIKAGTYYLGEKNHPVNPSHIAVVHSFFIAKTELTNHQFKQFVDATNYKTDAEKYKDALVFHPGLEDFEWLEDSTANWCFPNGLDSGGIENKMSHPVTCISYADALAYCKWAKQRLPTLDEWEIACRSGSNTHYFFGENDKELAKYANVWHGKTHLKNEETDGYLFTSPVASFLPNKLGLYDMYGNVFEFCADLPVILKDEKDLASARGGSWWCSKNSCSFFNSVDIGRVNIHASFSNQGFRVVKL